MDDQQRVIQVLRTSRIFHEFASAFEAVSGIQLCLNDHTSSFPPGCLNMHIESLTEQRYRMHVPVLDGIKIVAVIHTSTIYDGTAIAETVCKLVREPRNFKQTPAIPRVSITPHCKLLEIFARYLGHLANRMVLYQQNCEPGIVTKAKQYIHSHYQQPLPLNEVARNAHTSNYHLCKIFKKSTGLNFSNYIARVRVEAAKDLLDKPKLRINEIALEAGFQSLTHFNRVFKRFVGLSPRAFRNRNSYASQMSAKAHPSDLSPKLTKV